MGGKKKNSSNNNHQQRSNRNKQHDESKSQKQTHHHNLQAIEDEDEMDFCQRFFGDVLFSNLNVSLLFLTATFLPMLVWIPHFLKEYKRLRHLQNIEEERQLRIDEARLGVQKMQYDSLNGGSADDITILQDGVPPLKFPDLLDDKQDKHTAKILPSLCSDRETLGFDNWFTLRDAISEANAIAAEDFLRWNEYLVLSAKNKSLEPPSYSPPEPFILCPGAILNQKSPYGSILSPYYWASWFTFLLPQNSGRSKSKNKLSPIFINAEDIIIECVMCTVDLPGTHFSFGPHAKNVLIKGITFRGATTSSLTFHHHGADVALEDCYWLYNSGGQVNNRNQNDGNSNSGGSTTTAGAVADLNSTSTVTFFRCVIDDNKQTPKRTTTGAGVANVPGMNPPAGHVSHNTGGNVASSSLTIRN